MRICFDFDGYLCEYKGWRGHEDIGEPTHRVLWVKNLFDLGVELVLSSTRLNPFPFGEHLVDAPDEFVVSGKAKEIIMDWLKAQGILHCFLEITGQKPYADFYLDDRGWNPPWKELCDRIFTTNPDIQLLGEIQDYGEKDITCHYFLDGQCGYWHTEKALSACVRLPECPKKCVSGLRGEERNDG